MHTIFQLSINSNELFSESMMFSQNDNAFFWRPNYMVSALFKEIGVDANMEVWYTMEAFEQARIWAN